MEQTKRSFFFLVILSAFMAFASLSTDIYLPAMPAMQDDLGGASALTITGFLIGFAIAQLVWGPISDRIGRPIPLALGALLFLAGSIGCALSTSMEMVIAFRVVQAVGACVGPMLSRAMVRDLYTSSAAAAMLSTLVLIMAAAPIVGPLLGAFLLGIGGWRWIFWLMAAIAVLLFFSVRFLPETLPADKRSAEPLGAAFRSYGRLLCMRGFMMNTLSVTFFYVAAYAFITASAAVYIRHFEVDPQYYGLLFGVNIVGVAVVSFFNRGLVNRFSLSCLLKGATAAAAVFSLGLLACAVTGAFGLWGIAVPMFLIFSTNGIIAACSNAAALSKVPSEITGAAAALIGSLQYGSGMISSALLAMSSDGSPAAMCIIIAVSVVLSAITAFFTHSAPVKGDK
ncbi:multidrug effflux MFS transporter [Selenomonas noxia]|uniref:multidrug effflux MFS transporter n=1 Tax=Selenomonas noxia TaxID=135083 RepID=UPI00288BD10C|nr:multidrug effflux MFS transporter [Selenomonas noxia]